MTQYTKQFYSNNLKFQTALSEHLTPWIKSELKPYSVIDFGCGCGKLIADIEKAMAVDVFGLNFNTPDNLQIDKKYFRTADFTKPILIEVVRKFDLVISLEVAEHLPAESADTFIDTLTSHAKYHVLFSAAVPGQGGVNHINEQPHEYWHEKFKKRGFAVNDIVRPILKSKKSVPFWYRQNIFLYERVR